MPKIKDVKVKPGTGSQYADVSEGGSTVTPEGTNSVNSRSEYSVHGNNLGFGHGLYAGSNGKTRITMDFRSIVAGAGISVTGDAETLTITSTGTVTPNLSDMAGVLGVLQGGTGTTTLAPNGIVVGNGEYPVQTIPVPVGGNQVLTWTGASYAWSAMPQQTNGTVTSVGLTSGSAKITVSGAAITNSGTFTIDANESAFNLNNLNGTLSVAKGGTGMASLTSGALLVGNGINGIQPILMATAPGQVLTWTGSAYSWTSTATGTVTSVGLNGSNGITVSGSPITSAGTMTVSLAPTGVSAGTYSYPTVSVDAQGRVTNISSNSVTATDAANLGSVGSAIYAGKAGSTLNFKQLVGGTGVNLSSSATTVTIDLDVLGYQKGGTGATSYNTNGFVYAGGSSLLSTPAPTAQGQVPTWNGSAYVWTQPVTNVTVTGDAYLTVTPTSNQGEKNFAIEFNGSAYPINGFSGVLGVTKGGTGANYLAPKQVVLGNGSGGLLTVSPSGAGKYLFFDGTDVVWNEIAMTMSISAGQGLSTTPSDTAGGGTITTSGTLHLTDTGVVPGTYGVLSGTVDAKGRLTSASDVGEFVISRANHTGLMPLSALAPTSVNTWDFGTGSTLVSGSLETTSITIENVSGQKIDAYLTNATSNIDAGNLLINATDVTVLTNGGATGWTVDGFGNIIPFGTVNIGSSANRVGVIYASDINVSTLSPVAKSGAISDTTGTLPVTRGGTGSTSFVPGGLLVGSGIGPVTSTQAPTAANQVLTWDGTAFVWSVPATGSSGSVTSVGVDAGSNKLVVSGSPITSAGTITIDVDETNLNIGNMAGSIQAARVTGISTVATTGDYSDLINKPTLSSGTVTSVDVSAGSGKVSVTGSTVTSSGIFTIDVVESALNVGNMTGVLGVLNGGTGLSSLGTAGQVLAVNSSGTGYEFATLTGGGTAYSLPIASETVLGGVKVGSGLTIGVDGTLNATSGGTGTVTSVEVTPASSKIAITGSPITSTGTITVDVVESNLNIGNMAGSITPARVSGLSTVATTGNYADLTGTPTVPTNVSDLVNDSGFVTQSGARSAISATGSISYDSVTGIFSYTAPVLSTVATTGSYNDLLDKPTLSNGTVTSVAVTAGSSKVSVTGSPVTSSGVISVDVNEANLDISNMTGMLPVSLGGTGLATLGTAGQSLVVNAAGTGLEYATVSGGGSYTLPFASATVLGGVKVGSGLAIDANGVLSSTVVGGTGTVTSVSVAAGSNKVTVTGSPITSSGTVTVDIDETNINVANTTGDISAARVTGLSAVATSGSYADLTSKPTIPTTTSALTNDSGFITNADVRTQISVSGSLAYNSSTGVISYTAPVLAPVATSGAYSDLTGVPVLATVATSGSYNDLLNKPTLTNGTVTSVSVAAGSNKLSVTGSPITSSGTVTLDIAEANLNISNMTGTLGVTRGGTGLTTLGAAGQALVVNAAGTGYEFATVGGSSYTLPIASATVLGGVKVGSGLTIDGSGVLSATGGGSGEVNTASNVGTGTGVFYQKSGTDLQFKSLTAGANVTLSDDGVGNITISSTATGGAASGPTGSVAPGWFTFSATLNAGGTSVASVSNIPAGWNVVIGSAGLLTVTHNVGRAPYSGVMYGLNGGIYKVRNLDQTANGGTFSIPDGGGNVLSTTTFTLIVTAATSGASNATTVIIRVMF